MTWDEFKRHVDKMLSEKGHDGTVPLEYIKFVSGSNRSVSVHVDAHEPSLQVWNEY